MDIKEFDLLYNKASPIFHKNELGKIISQALEEEQIPHSRKPSQCSGYLNFDTFTLKPAIKRDTELNVSEIKGEQHDSWKIKSFLNSNSKQSYTSVNGASSRKLSSPACDNSLTLKTNGNITNTSVLDDYIQQTSYDIRKGVKEGKYFTTKSRVTSQDKHDDFTKSSGLKHKSCRNSCTGYNRGDESYRPPDIGMCKCKKWKSCRESSMCRHSNLETKIISTDTATSVRQDINNCTNTNDTNHDEVIQKKMQSLSDMANIPAKLNNPAYTCDVQQPCISSLSTPPFHDRPGVVRSPPATVDDGREELGPKHDVAKDESNKTDGQTNGIIPVEIGRFDKKAMVAMIETLVAANQVFSEFPRKHEPEKKLLLQEQNEYLEKKKQQEAILNDNVEDEKNKIRVRVLEHSVKYIEMRIAESVKFAKKIPGFTGLPLEDQANLIRESRTESGIVGGMRGINTEKGVFSTKHGANFSMDDMKLVFDETLLKEKMILSQKIAKLNMSFEEEAILRALTITATDRCELVRKDLAEDIQNKLMSCLIHVISGKGQESVSKRLGKLCDVLMSCRYVTEVDLKQVKKIFLEWPSFSKYKLAEEFL